jgi:NAD(P)-dependent dehydrogenase (short-subunit alcohol dehydrogenase family)
MKIEDLFNIKEKVFLVTGAYGLIGKHVCKFLADNDAIVIAIGRREEKLKDLKKEKETITIIKTDISSESEVISLYKNLTKKIKKVDVIVNIAAKSTSNTFENLVTKEWDEVIATNLRGTFLMCREGVNSGLFKKGSSIINISSIYGIVSPDQRIYGDTGINSSLVYGSSKAGVIQLTKYLATYLADRGIRVNCISPGGIFNNQPEYFLQRYIKKTPLGRMGAVDDILGTIVFLSSEKASGYITGANIVIDGGFTIW